MADCCSFPPWMPSQGSARPPVQAADSHTSAWTPVTRARMLYRLYSCTCQRASTDTMLGILQFTRCLLKNRRHPQPQKLVLSTCFVNIWQTWHWRWGTWIVAVFLLGWKARAVPAPWYRGDTVTPPPPLLQPGPACWAAAFPLFPLTPVAIRNHN